MIANDTTDSFPYIKAAAIWGGVIFGKLGIHNWSDVSAIIVSVWTLFLIYDWLQRWKKRK